MDEALTKLLECAEPAPQNVAAALQVAVELAVERYLVRERFADSRRRKPLREWDYLWDALAWSENLKSRKPVKEWLPAVGPCWMLADRCRGQAWLVKDCPAGRFRDQDVYLVPISDCGVCYINTHEPDIGPFLITLLPEESQLILEAAGMEGVE